MLTQPQTHLTLLSEGQFPQKNWPSMWAGLSVKRMKAEGKSPKTIENYTRAIRHFTSTFKKHPKVITQAEIKNYLFNFIKEKSYGPATHNLHVSGIKYFYNTVLGISEKDAALIKKRVSLKLFEVFSQSELALIFQNEPSPRNRLLLKAGYAFGLRVNRAVTLKLSDFDFNRNLLFIKGAKGKKDRFVMLSQDLSRDLHHYIETANIEDHIFPGTGPDNCVSSRQANYILHRAAERAGISKSISFHTLRRSYATHLHEAGYSLRDIQVLMGHSTSRTTERYTRVSNKHISQIKNPLDSLAESQPERRKISNSNSVEFPQNFNQNQTTKVTQPAISEKQSISPYRQDPDYRAKGCSPYS